jgi:hypothetical protein
MFPPVGAELRYSVNLAPFETVLQLLELILNVDQILQIYGEISVQKLLIRHSALPRAH